jgi:hypothetical protein
MAKRLADMTPISHGEFLRAIVTKDGPTSYIIDPAALAPDPFAFGMALVDCVRHGARAWSAATGVEEETVRERIWEGLDTERLRPTSDLD